MPETEALGQYHQILKGVPRHQGVRANDPSSGARWDKIQAEVNAIKKANPKAVFDTVHEI